MKLLTILCSAADNPVTRVSELLAQQGIDIRSMDFSESRGQAFLNLAVSDHDAALKSLVGAGYQTVSSDIVLLRTEDRPGALAQVSRQITDHGIGIRSLTLMQVDGGSVVCAVATTDNPRVRELFGADVVN
jgi:histidine decarboxylase